MGNRAYITIKTNNQAITHYVHWNGGKDTLLPLMASIKAIAWDVNHEEIRAAFEEISGQPMQVIDDENSKKWVEENGHYFIDLNTHTFIRVYEIENSLTGLYDRLSEVLFGTQTEYNDYIKSCFKPEAQNNAMEQWGEKVKLFNEALVRLGLPRREKIEAFKKELKGKENKTFKALMKEDILKEFPSIWPKVKSIRYKSFSMGDSVDVTCDELTEEERNYMKTLCRSYQDGYFNGMDDSYVMDKTRIKARTAKYVFLNRY